MRVKKGSSKQLADFRKTFRSDSPLLGAVERFVVQRAMEDNGRERHAIHPSELANRHNCLRQMYYRIVDTPEEVSEANVTFWRERIFAEGHLIHEKWQQWFWDMGELWGFYECLVCDERWWAKSPQECAKCAAPRRKLVYREVPIENAEHMIVGHADGEFDSGLIEIKSIGTGTLRVEAPGFYDKLQSGEWDLQKVWNEIKRPLPSHVRQGMLYSFCRDRKPVTFIYECKWNQAVKEFTVSYSEDIVAPMLDACLDIKYAVEKRRPVGRPQWADPEASACKACPYKRTCYDEVSGEKPARSKWKVKE